MTAQPGSAISRDYRPEEMQYDPYPFYERARREEPVFHCPIYESWLVTRYQDVRDVLADAGRYTVATGLRAMDRLDPAAVEELRRAIPTLPEGQADPGEEARLRARKPIQRAFTPDRVATLHDHLRDRVSSLVEEFVTNGPGDLMAGLAHRLPVHAKAKTLGLADDDIDAVTNGSHSLTLLASDSNSLSPAQQREHASRAAAYQCLLDDYAQRRCADPQDDLFTAVVTAVAPGATTLALAERKAVVEAMAGLIGAGHGTTSAAVGMAVWQLMLHRDQWDILCASPELAADAVEELLRYDMPLQGLFRVTTEPVQLGGKELPEGTRLIAMYASGNRDETVFTAPDRLDITRKPGRHLSFGHGARACVGMHLARKLLQLTLVELTRCVPTLRLAHPDAAVLLPGMHRVLRSLDVAW